MTTSDLTPAQPDPQREESEKALRAALVCKLRKDHWGALVEAQRACQLDPRHREAHELASDYARDLSQWDDAVAYLERAHALDPEDPARTAKLERLQADAAVFSRPVAELVTEAREGAESWATVLKSIFFRPDPVWFRAGWFHLVMAVAGLVLFLLLFWWFLSTGPWFLLFALVQLGMVGWVAYDAHTHGEPALLWGIIAMFASVFGFALYLTVRNMGSGIGVQGGNRFFSG